MVSVYRYRLRFAVLDIRDNLLGCDLVAMYSSGIIRYGVYIGSANLVARVETERQAHFYLYVRIGQHGTNQPKRIVSCYCTARVTVYMKCVCYCVLRFFLPCVFFLKLVFVKCAGFCFSGSRFVCP